VPRLASATPRGPKIWLHHEAASVARKVEKPQPPGCNIRWKHLDATGTVGPKEGAVEIGDPERTYTVEPLEDPVPREPSQPPEEAPEQEPLEPERVDAE
jgi:hypothetical protein